MRILSDLLKKQLGERGAFLNTEYLIKNATLGFGLGAVFGLMNGGLIAVLMMGFAGAIIFSPIKYLNDYKAQKLDEKINFERHLCIWMQSVVLMLSTGVHPLVAVSKSSKACENQRDFKELTLALESVGDLYKAVMVLSASAQSLEVQRFCSRILVYESQGNAMLIQLMEGDANEFAEKFTEKAQMKIEKSVIQQALPSLLIFATIMLHMMYPLLLGGLI